MTTNTNGLPQCWQDLHDTIEAGLSRVCLWGPPGTGKTYAALTHALDGRPTYKISCVDDMTTAQIEGMWKPARDGWKFEEGAAVKAWRNGGRLVIDEIDKASGDVLGALLQFCDSEASARWDHPDTGEIVTPSSGFSIIITTNAHPDTLAEALRDRFPVAVNVTEPHPVALSKLPQFLREPARLLANAEPDTRVSMRGFLAMAQLADKIGLERAASLVMPQHLETIVAASKIAAITGEA